MLTNTRQTSSITTWSCISSVISIRTAANVIGNHKRQTSLSCRLYCGGMLLPIRRSTVHEKISPHRNRDQTIDQDPSNHVFLRHHEMPAAHTSPLASHRTSQPVCVQPTHSLESTWRQRLDRQRTLPQGQALLVATDPFVPPIFIKRIPSSHHHRARMIIIERV